jgi:uncharacterized protein
MEIEYNSDKRDKTLLERELDFKHAPLLFAGAVYESISPQAHGEERIITIGTLNDEIIVVVWTYRGKIRRIISMRKARDNEKLLYLDR